MFLVHMDLLVRVAVLVAVLALALAVGLRRRRTDGRAAPVAAGDVLTAADLGAPLGGRATLLQVSTQFCAPCRATRAVLAPLARDVDGVVHVELSAEDHVDLVRRLDVTRTPTLLVLDAGGRVTSRTHGVPTAAAVLDALPGREALR